MVKQTLLFKIVIATDEAIDEQDAEDILNRLEEDVAEYIVKEGDRPDDTGVEEAVVNSEEEDDDE